jgi:hypothetical protein
MADTITVNVGEGKVVQLERFYRSGSTGVADSIEAVQEASGLIRLPSYGVAIARALDSQNDALWTSWHDLDAEQIRATATKNYDGVLKGDHRLFLVGASAFSQDPKAIRSFIEGKGSLDGKEKVGLTNYSVPLSQTGQIDRLLGDRVVYVTGADGVPNEKTVDRIMTYDQFREASQDKDFLADHHFYVVQFSEQNIPVMKSGYLPIESRDVLEHPTSIVLSGGARIWQAMLNAGEGRGFTNFYVGNPDLDQNSGRVVIAYHNHHGFDAPEMDDDGGSLGVAPEALDALVEASRGLVVPIRPIQEEKPAYKGLVIAEANALRGVPVGQLTSDGFLEQRLNKLFEQYARMQQK